MKLKQLILLSAMLLNYFLPSVASDQQGMDIVQESDNEAAVQEILALRDELAAAVQRQRTTIGLFQEARGAIDDLSNTQAGRELPDSQQMIRAFQIQLQQLLFIIGERNQFITEGNDRLEMLILQLRRSQPEPMDEND